MSLLSITVYFIKFRKNIIYLLLLIHSICVESILLNVEGIKKFKLWIRGKGKTSKKAVAIQNTYIFSFG